jgi:hypothetical protein
MSSTGCWRTFAHHVGHLGADQQHARSMMPTLLQMSASSGRMWLETMIVLPSLRSSFKQAADLDPRAGVQAAGRLVQQQHLGIVQEHAGQAQPLGHAAGKAGHKGVALVAQVDQIASISSQIFRRAGPLMR